MFSVTPTNQIFPAAGGIGVIDVTAPCGCPWTAESNAGFITITSETNGTFSGKIRYSVAPNMTSHTITGTLTVAGQIVTVTMVAPPTILYSFGPLYPDGDTPLAGLVLGSDGNFYGTTEYGGQNLGNIFRISPSGDYTNLYSFGTSIENGNATDGFYPDAPLVQGSDGNFYGTTPNGGSWSNCIPRLRHGVSDQSKR
jgi:uncharacterized repeat protein (TIGR03803 family)